MTSSTEQRILLLTSDERVQLHVETKMRREQSDPFNPLFEPDRRQGVEEAGAEVGDEGQVLPDVDGVIDAEARIRLREGDRKEDV